MESEDLGELNRLCDAPHPHSRFISGLNMKILNNSDDIQSVYIYIYICIEVEDYHFVQTQFPTLSCPLTSKVLHIISEIYFKNKTQNDAVEKELSQLIEKLDINDRFHNYDEEVTCLLHMGKFYENKYVIKLIINHPKFDPLLCSIMLGRNILNVILHSDEDETCEDEFKIIAITAILKKLVLVYRRDIDSEDDDKEYIANLKKHSKH